MAIPQWTAKQRPQQIDMRGQYCTLTPLKMNEHAASLYQAFCEDAKGANWTYLPYGPFQDFDGFNEWLSGCTTKDPLFYAIVDKKTSTAIGLASYLRIEPSVGVVEVGHIHFSPQLQKKPMATESMYLMMKYVFDQLGYRRYEWKCDALNVASRKAALRLGFKFEGIFRQATIYKGRNRDTAWFSVLDSEWPALKTAFEHWLNTDNFSAEGLQKHSLQDCVNATKLSRRKHEDHN
ncbi:GNAT family N-acetyltransferase [Aestuariirhabdus sp. LZHN29]|uniref:GNAT family N-acetyltransferase n=1 Tax=Aestuariirhabdus sp. LZHN29 TaxID=3417462 RepID=UPI003CF3D21E